MKNSIWKKFAWSALALGMLASQPAIAQAPAEKAKESVGTIRSITGLVSLRTSDGKSKFASNGTKLFKGDIINTQDKSTAVLEFIDTTQVALRPQTRFVVENYEYQPEEPVADKAEFKLVKGGLRTLTGLIGKRGNQDAFAMKSETATIGIRGTDFSMRLCKGDDCKQTASSETTKSTNTNASTADVSGRVSQLSGELSATNEAGKTRPLKMASAFFAGDTLTVSDEGFAVVTMADGSRLTLPGGSSMQVAAYRYAPASPKTSVASFKLIKGAVRAVTGAISKAEPNNVKFFTETATIGIRGTAFDISCTPAQSTPGGPVLVTCTGAANFTVEMRQGQITLTTGGTTSVVNAGQAAILNAGAVKVDIKNFLPNLLNNVPNAGPLPEKTPNNFENLNSTPASAIQPGGDGANKPSGGVDSGGGGKGGDEGQLFVSVNDGTVVISNKNSNNPLEVNRGEGAFLSTRPGTPPVLLTSPPDVLTKDNTLAAPPFTAPQCAQ